jgi:hypothetical protein
VGVLGDLEESRLGDEADRIAIVAGHLTGGCSAATVVL